MVHASHERPVVSSESFRLVTPVRSMRTRLDLCYRSWVLRTQSARDLCGPEQVGLLV